MNATEQLVEVYYRQRGCFTVTDIKVDRGNNRQFDILTYDSINQNFSHIEVSVTHTLNWISTLEQISERVRYKFFGIPKNSRPDNDKTDFAKGKTYLEAINSTYSKYGIDTNNVKRVWCTWGLPENEIQNIGSWKQTMADEFNLLPENFEILLFRDEVLPAIFRNIGTCNYDDELLRTLSLINEFRKQTPPSQ